MSTLERADVVGPVHTSADRTLAGADDNTSVTE